MEVILTLLLMSWVGHVSAQKGPGLIVGGTDANVETYPHQVSLQTKNGGHFCGGSIVDNKYIVTAAHCVTRWRKRRVVVGITKLNEPITKLRVRRVTKHPNYNRRTLENDIAVLKLRRPLTYDNKTQKVPLPSQDDLPVTATNVIATGWGTTTEGGSVANTLQEVTLQVIGNNDCNTNYNGEIEDTMMCAAAPGKDSCQGDSGGPLIEEDSGKLVGIVSWGYGCARPAYPGVYTLVSAYIDWINNTMANTLTGV